MLITYILQPNQYSQKSRDFPKCLPFGVTRSPVPFPVLTRITPDPPCMRTLYKITSHNTNTDSASYGKSYRHPVTIAEVSTCIVSNAETMEISRYHTPLLLAPSVYMASVIKTD